MDAIELRINNYIKDKNGNICQVREITDYDRVFVGENKLVQDLRNCEPIPITKELLLKCGFKRIKYENKYILMHFYSGLYINILDLRAFKGEIDKCKYIIYCQDHGFYVRYLHQLQNIYYMLFCKELQINL